MDPLFQKYSLHNIHSSIHTDSHLLFSVKMHCLTLQKHLFGLCRFVQKLQVIKAEKENRAYKRQTGVKQKNTSDFILISVL